MRNFSINLILFFSFLLSPFAIVQDSEGLEEVIVTAQRQEQSLQDVPLAVSSFSGDDLLEQQIEGINDMQLFVPGLRFGGNIGEGGGDLEIRGMVNGAVSGTADPAVGVHINDLAVGVTPLDTGQLFDMERVEIIRGPAGTLYGRNAIGGSLNMITAKADPTSFSGKASVDLGNYGRFGTTTVMNIPLDDNAAFRFASSTLRQDGLVDNIYSEGLDYNLDNRNQMGYRATLSFDPSEKTTIHIIHQAQIEDSKRTLTSGTWCDRDPSAVFGCTMQAPENQKFEIAHPMSTLVEQLLIAQGVLDYTPVTSLAGAPQKLWTMNVRNEPSYNVDEYITQFIVEHDINDELLLSVAASRKDRKFYRVEAYESPELDTLRFNDTPVTPGGVGTMSASIDSNCSVEGYTAGFYGGCILDRLNYPTGAFNYSALADTDAVEMKLVSSFDGPHNFLFGTNYFKNYQDDDTDVVASGLDALTVSPPAAMIGTQAASLGAQLYAPFFRTANTSVIESTAVFGEYYFEVRDDLKLTFGLRYTDDFKEAGPSNPSFNILGYARGNITDAAASAWTGGLVPSAAAWEALFCPEGASFCPVPESAIPGNKVPAPGEAYRTAGLETTRETSEFTGRFVVDYFINDDSMMFVSLSTGFKGGGINPGFDPISFAGVPTGFPNSEVDNLEIGFKNEFPEQGIRFNVSAYYSDIENYHITQIKNRTSVNEGIDVEIMGAEADLLYLPPEVPGFSLNASLSYTTSSIKDGEGSIDMVNRDLQLTGGAGSSEWHTVKDQVSETFIVRKTALEAMWNTFLQEFATQGAAVTPADGISALNPALDGITLAGLVFFNPIEHHGDRTFGQPTPVSYWNPLAGQNPADGHLPSVLNRAQGLHQILAQLHGFDLVAGNDISEGLISDVSGNSLFHPELQANLGLGYLQDAGNLKINYRLDYSYQGERYLRVFNLPSDLLEAWDELGAQVTLSSSSDSWYVQFYGQNITDNESYYYRELQSTAVGNFQRIMARERARYGVRFGWNF